MTVSKDPSFSPYPAPDRRFVVMRGRTATFEDGCRMAVGAFSIRRAPITTAEFQSFIASTGYEPTAGVLFGFDETMDSIRAEDLPNVPAHNVSFDDAVAYCEWARLRLPTEAEWLAAAILDERIMDQVQYQDFLFGKSGRFDIEKHPEAILVSGPEWVVGDAPPGHAVVRSGPCYVRTIGWEKQLSRCLWPRDTCDITLGFRVCSDQTGQCCL